MISDIQREKLDEWIRSLLWEGNLLGNNNSSSQPISVHRMKGRIVLQNNEEWILQGVREVYEFRYMGKSHGENSKIVLIGEGLRKEDIEESLHLYLGV